ncbi:MAG: RND family transporter [Myxococcales bacterium]|nr:RND family transporter [Myxococcales bacterium]
MPASREAAGRSGAFPVGKRRLEALFERLAGFVIARRTGVVVALAVLTAAFAARLTDLRVDFSHERLFSAQDPERAAYARKSDIFGPDDNVLVVILEVTDPSRDVFQPAVLAEVARIAEALERVEGITRVVSLVDAPELYPNDGGFDVRPLVDALPADPAALASLRARVVNHPAYGGLIVSRDGRMTAILAEIDADAYPMDRDRIPILLDARRVIGASDGDERAVPPTRVRPARGARIDGIAYHLTGVPAVRFAYEELILRDQALMVPIVLAIIAAILAFVFRESLGVVLPLITVGVSVLWAMGALVALGGVVDLLTNVLPILLLVVGVADSIHIVSRYLELFHETGNKALAIRRTMGEMGMACLLTSATTAIGFASLYTSGMRIIREFGAFSALGVMLAFVVTMLVLPLAFSLWRAPAFAGAAPALEDRWHRGMSRLAAFDRRHATAIVLAASFVAGLGAWGLTRARADIRILEDIDPTHPAAVATRLADRNLGGVLPVEILVEGPDGAFKDPANLKRLGAIESFLDAQPETGRTQSLAGLIERVNEAVAPEGNPGREIPGDPRTVAEYLLLLSLTDAQGEVERLATADFSKARIATTTRDVGSAQLLAMRDRVRRYIDRSDMGLLRATVTGSNIMAANAMVTLVGDMMKSFALAFFFILVIMTLELRSLRWGLIAMVPNVLPALLTVGFLGFIGEPIRTSTALIFAISLGIAVDDTIHFLVRYARELADGHDHEAALGRTLVSTGRAIFVTTVVLVAGFGALLFSNFVATRSFGMLCGLTLTTALAVASVVLPAILTIVRPSLPAALRATAGPGADGARKAVAD